MKLHIVKAELTTSEKMLLKSLAEKEKRSVKKQIEWIIKQRLKKERESYGLTKENN
tara:strand:- start:2289 stop:2456 length:168 start_codon:yes stop_codon:yes gene_type:complete